jgi:outer membrane cobalamin receptor
MFLLGVISVTAQNKSTTLSGKVVNNLQQPIPYATIVIGKLSIGTTTDEQGNYRLKNIHKGSYKITISSIGYIAQTKTILFLENETPVNFRLKVDIANLEEVIVTAKTKTTVIKEQPYAVASIDVKPLKALNLDVNQILNTSTGVRIRETGGLGSDFNFSLNGFSGNKVKFFMDGIPMDNFGSSLSLNNIPVNYISRIEIYKGVVPIELGADALGGAINIITNQSLKNYLDVSYSYGSFNTHRASVISKTLLGKSLYLKANAFVNYSDNNYIIEAEYADLETGAFSEPEEFKRFHDTYRSQALELELGVKNKKYADQLSLDLIVSKNYKEIQTGTNQAVVIGDAHNRDKVLIPSLKYLKKNLFVEGLTARLSSVYNIAQSKRIDTSSYRYTWKQEKVLDKLNPEAGEISDEKTLFSFNDKSFTNNTNLNYDISENQNIAINNIYNYFKRNGEDPLAQDKDEIAYLEPSTLKKNITGFGYYINAFDKKWRTNIFGKLYNLKATAFDYNYNTDALEQIAIDKKFRGYGIASTYFFAKGIQIKMSFEKTYRLPETYELFGNGLTLVSNLYLEPEESSNFNINVLSRKKIAKGEILFEAGYLHRLPKNLIYIQQYSATESQYVNLSSVKSNIFEGGIKYKYKNFLNLSVNASYQNIINTQKRLSNGNINYVFEDRIPNTPYLFGNLLAQINFNNVFHKTGRFSVNWNSLFVEEFYLRWPSQGDPDGKYTIPRQISHNLTFSYSLYNGKYNVSLGINNLTDDKLYDNFKLQKPGRAINIKLNYSL